jgi:hypothetical protein
MMEPVKIETLWDQNTFLRLGKVQWEITYRKFQKNLKYYFITAGILLILGFIARYEEDSINPFIIIGFVFLTISLFMTLLMFGLRRNYLKRLSSLANKFETLKMDCTIEVTDENVKYWDKEKYFELKWTAFSSYSCYKNYLILSTPYSLANSIILEKTESDFIEYDKIFELAKAKLIKKEVS